MSNFPIIRKFDDVKFALDNECFLVVERDGYILIDYVKLTSDAFRPISEASSEEDRKVRQMRREFRGLMFDASTGLLIRRPLHKFKNLHEDCDSTLDRFTSAAYATEKLDGSMIAPFFTKNEIYYGTRMCSYEHHKMVEQFTKDRLNYQGIIELLLEGYITPVFEFCSRQNKVVIDHPEDRLILTQARHQISGNYLDYSYLKQLAESFDVEVAECWASDFDSVSLLVDDINNKPNVEGIVIQEGSNFLKVKTDEYVAIHKALSDVLKERHVAALLYDNKLDDILPKLPADVRAKVEDFTKVFATHTINLAHSVWADARRVIVTEGVERKDFTKSDFKYPQFNSVIFKNYYTLDEYEEMMQTFVCDFDRYVMKYFTSDTKFKELKEKIGMEDYVYL